MASVNIFRVICACKQTSLSQTNVKLLTSPFLCGLSKNVIGARSITKQIEVPLPPGKGKKQQYRRLVQYPEEYTIKKLPIIKLGGRDPYTGRVVVGTVGGGRPQKARWIDYIRKANEDGSPYVERVFNIVHNPHNAARLAVVGGKSAVRYIIAHANMKIGDIIKTHAEIPKNPVRPVEGDAYPMGALPVGTIIHSVEKIPGEGGYFCINAGTSALLLRKIKDMVIVRLASKQEICVNQHCKAVVGQVSNVGHKDIPVGSPNRLRRLGRRSRSGLWHRKDGYCGRKVHPLPPLKVYTTPYKDTQTTLLLNLPDMWMDKRTKPALIPDDSWVWDRR